MQTLINQKAIEARGGKSHCGDWVLLPIVLKSVINAF